jgi:hypothetical protein
LQPGGRSQARNEISRAELSIRAVARRPKRCPLRIANGGGLFASPISLGRFPMRIDIDEIRRRAHELWELAGKPDGREDEFWLEAERELKEKQIRHELKTPDNL